MNPRSSLVVGRQSTWPLNAITFRLLTVTGTLLFLAGLCTAILTVQLVRVSYSPTPFGDQWGVVDDLSSGLRWWSPVWLWRQSNEHRIPLFRLSYIADIKLFGGHSILLF